MVYYLENRRSLGCLAQPHCSPGPCFLLGSPEEDPEAGLWVQVVKWEEKGMLEASGEMRQEEAAASKGRVRAVTAVAAGRRFLKRVKEPVQDMCSWLIPPEGRGSWGIYAPPLLDIG